MQYIVQPAFGHKYVELLSEALRHGACTQFHAAVAYATVGGVHQLEKAARLQIGNRWDEIEKKWLVGIDWCRSDPPALNRLQNMPNSQLRIPSGESLLGRPGCIPSQTFHPKLYVLRGPERAAIVCGSGNLSANGLLRGCECGSLHSMSLPAAAGENDAIQLGNLDQWFATAWNEAHGYADLQTRYEALCRQRVRQRLAVPTEDDNSPPEPAPNRKPPLTEEQIRQLRTFDTLWIEAGVLGGNLGRGRPGNQLDMKRFTRAFFGAPVTDVPPNEEIDRITLVWEEVQYNNCTLKYGDNGMDKLNVPPSGDRGPEYYRGKTLLFLRNPTGRYQFVVGDETEKRTWRRQSERLGTLHRVGQREWGVF